MSFINLIYELFLQISDTSIIDYINETGGVMELFGMCLVILIGVEILETIKAYLKEDVVHVEVILLVAIIAVAKKIITLDYDKYSSMTLIGMGVLVLALTGGYYLVKYVDYKYTVKG